MKNIFLKTCALGVVMFLMAFCYFSVSVPAQAGVLNNSYDELAAQFPEYISDLTATNEATEGQIRAFVNDLDAALQGRQLNEGNFYSTLRTTVIQTALNPEHADVASAILGAYGSDLLQSSDDESNIPSFFRPLYTVLKDKFLSSPAPSPAGGGGGGAAVPDPKPAVDITVTIDGGTFTSVDGQAGLIVPEGTLSQEATINIVLVTEPIPDPTMDFASNVYEFTSSAAFNGAVTITLKYDPAKVADPAKLGIYYYNETLGQWVFVGGTVDPATGTVAVTVDHFTKFAILAKPAKVTLTDIDKHWGYRYIDRLVGMGIISGYGDGTFRPEQTISRAEFAAIIAKARGLTLDSQAALTFSDAEAVPGWAAPAVAAAVKAGVISGYEDNTFGPDRQITRAELATMIVRAMNISPAASPVLTYSDAGDIPAWARGYVATAVEQGIITGRSDNTFGSQDNATRAEAATMVIKMLEALGI